MTHTTTTQTPTDATNPAASTDRAAAVGAIYAAFGRGDVPYILDQLSDDVAWEEGIRETGLPWLRTGRGKQHVAGFFDALAEGLQFTTFEPQIVAQAGDDVVAVLREGAIALATGTPVEEDLYVHVWRFDLDGKVAAFRHIGDWHRQEVAVRGNAT